MDSFKIELRIKNLGQQIFIKKKYRVCFLSLNIFSSSNQFSLLSLCVIRHASKTRPSLFENEYILL
jgi:hypothetical protein